MMDKMAVEASEASAPRWKAGALGAVSAAVMCAGFWASQQSAYAPLIDMAARVEAAKTFESIQAASGQPMESATLRALGPRINEAASARAEPEARVEPIGRESLAAWRSERGGSAVPAGLGDVSPKSAKARSQSL